MIIISQFTYNCKTKKIDKEIRKKEHQLKQQKIVIPPSLLCLKPGPIPPNGNRMKNILRRKVYWLHRLEEKRIARIQHEIQRVLETNRMGKKQLRRFKEPKKPKKPKQTTTPQQLDTKDSTTNKHELRNATTKNKPRYNPFTLNIYIGRDRESYLKSRPPATADPIPKVPAEQPTVSSIIVYTAYINSQPLISGCQWIKRTNMCTYNKQELKLTRSSIMIIFMIPCTYAIRNLFAMMEL
jgi:hypothetical protein